MPIRDLSAFLEDDALTYEGIKSKAHPEGHTYRVASPDARTGLKLARLAERGVEAAATEAPDVLADADERDMFVMVLGDTLAEMQEDGVSWGVVTYIVRDAFLYWTMGQEFADLTAVAQGEAVARQNRAERRAEAKKSRTTTRTPRKTAGSKSATASTPTAARTRKPATTTRSRGRSSTPPSGSSAAAEAV